MSTATATKAPVIADHTLKQCFDLLRATIEGKIESPALQYQADAAKVIKHIEKILKDQLLEANAEFAILAPAEGNLEIGGCRFAAVSGSGTWTYSAALEERIAALETMEKAIKQDQAKEQLAYEQARDAAEEAIREGSPDLSPEQIGTRVAEIIGKRGGASYAPKKIDRAKHKTFRVSA